MAREPRLQKPETKLQGKEPKPFFAEMVLPEPRGGMYVIIALKPNGQCTVPYNPKNCTPQQAFDAVKLLHPDWQEITIRIVR